MGTYNFALSEYTILLYRNIYYLVSIEYTSYLVYIGYTILLISEYTILPISEYTFKPISDRDLYYLAYIEYTI